MNVTLLERSHAGRSGSRACQCLRPSCVPRSAYSPVLFPQTRLRAVTAYNLNTGELSWTSTGEFDGYDDDDPYSSSLDSESIATLLSASNELRELAHLSLSILVAALEAGVGHAAEGAVLRCAIYSRLPTSLSSGKLQLELVAATDGHEAEAAQARQDLFLGVPGASGSYQEAWIIEQPVIMLPDSGGMVLPLAHNSFLVGLLVVERCRAEGTGELANQLQAPAATLFGYADLVLVRQSGRALALACAMDLRASLERAGHVVRQVQVQGLVREARKPLRTLRTLGAMLRPRLEEGELERDMADGIVAQGERLGELVNQLQAALAPPPGAAHPAATLPPAGAAQPGGWMQQQATESTGWPGGQPAQQRGGAAAGQYKPQYPALPSSSIGADNWGAPAPNGSYLDSGNGSEGGSTPHPPKVANQGRGHFAAGAGPPAPPPGGPAPPPPANLQVVLGPLLATASNFASVSGVSFVVAAEEASAGSAARLPAAHVAAEVLPLKRMLAALLDGTIAWAARGDRIEVAVQLQSWGGNQGVAVIVRLVLSRDADGASGGGNNGEPERTRRETFAALAGAAQQVGGWFNCELQPTAEAAEPSLHVYPVDPGAVMAVLWLPVATSDR